MKKEEIHELIEKAKLAREKAYAPYSNYKVGACVVTSTGKVFSGCNVENASYGGAICAERVAITKAISEGEKSFKAIVVVSHSAGKAKTAPCGFCRQFIYEFAPNVEVITSDLKGNYQIFSMETLLPHAFGPKNLFK